MENTLPQCVFVVENLSGFVKTFSVLCQKHSCFPSKVARLATFLAGLLLFERGLVGNGGVLTKNNSRKVGLRELGGGGTGVLPVGCKMRYLTRYLHPSMM